MSYIIKGDSAISLAPIIEQELKRFKSEKDFRVFILNFFKKKYHFVESVHGPTERGLDLLLCFPREYDILNKGQFLLFQIKINDITTDIWRKSLHSQMLSLFYRQIKYTDYKNDETTRRVILITNRQINENVKEEIRDINSKSIIPIKYFDGTKFSYVYHFAYVIKHILISSFSYSD